MDLKKKNQTTFTFINRKLVPPNTFVSWWMKDFYQQEQKYKETVLLNIQTTNLLTEEEDIVYFSYHLCHIYYY